MVGESVGGWWSTVVVVCDGQGVDSGGRQYWSLVAVSLKGEWWWSVESEVLHGGRRVHAVWVGRLVEVVEVVEAVEVVRRRRQR